MRPDDIPEDVWEMARETQNAAINACADANLIADAYPLATDHAKEVLDEHIARALLAYGQRRADEATERAAPKIKPLEWKEEGKGRWSAMPTNGLGHLAYWIFLQSDGCVCWNGAKREVYPTLDAAKAFYQADYEARILSALVQS